MRIRVLDEFTVNLVPNTIDMGNGHRGFHTEIRYPLLRVI